MEAAVVPPKIGRGNCKSLGGASKPSEANARDKMRKPKISANGKGKKPAKGETKKYFQHAKKKKRKSGQASLLCRTIRGE